MILNISRISQFQECRQKAYYWHEARLTSHREADALLLGGAFHHGVAKFFATGDAEVASKFAEDEFRERIAAQPAGLILPEELEGIEKQISFTKRAVNQYADYYKQNNFQILYPEVKFSTAMPNTWHHCWFAHRLIHPDVPFSECPAESFTPGPEPSANNLTAQYKSQKCFMPHVFTGTTDGLIKMNGMLWLLEHKTTAISGAPFFDRFYLDFQPTGYMYGIWKALGTRPHGFILNVIKKPNRAAKDQDRVGFEREAYLRTDSDLLRFEREFILQANDYEDAFKNGKIYLNTKSCTNYNRRCYYFDTCLRGGPEEGEFRARPRDYVDKEYFRYLGVPEPPDPNLVQINMETPNAS